MKKRGVHMPNRLICSVLEEMRKAYETRNFSYLPGLIEEAQSLANRMESKLWDQHDFTRTQEEHKRLKEEIKKMNQDGIGITKVSSEAW
jgi:hypothetical protein